SNSPAKSTLKEGRMLCPSCHIRNRENARFCKGCGQTLAIEIVVTAPTQSAAATAPVETDLDKTVPARPPAFPSSEEPTQYLQPQPLPQSTQQSQPVRHGQAQGMETSPGVEASPIPTQVGGGGIDENDLTMAPTQILTPAQRIEYLTRHWQQERQREQG